jgi:hypothetical protein
MDVINESPVRYTDGEAEGKAGKVFYDHMTTGGAYVYWMTDTTWMPVPRELVELVTYLEAGQVRAKVQAQELQDIRVEVLDANNAKEAAQKGLEKARITEKALRSSKEHGADAHKETAEKLMNAQALVKAGSGFLEAAQEELGATRQELEAAQDSIKGFEGQLEAAQVNAHLSEMEIDGLKDHLEEAALAPVPTTLAPEEVVELRASCSVDEILRMREAGVV